MGVTEDKLLRLDEVADLLRVSMPTLRRMLSRGEVKVIRFTSKTYRIRESDLMSYMMRKRG